MLKIIYRIIRCWIPVSSTKSRTWVVDLKDPKSVIKLLLMDSTKESAFNILNWSVTNADILIVFRYLYDNINFQFWKSTGLSNINSTSFWIVGYVDNPETVLPVTPIDIGLEDLVFQIIYPMNIFQQYY